MAETVLCDAQPVGEHDQAVSEAIDKEILLESAEENIQQQVREALRRLEDGTFGLCEECGRPIAKARLDAVPFAAYCVHCMRTHENN
jgi:DnaK suppressor protein